MGLYSTINIIIIHVRNINYHNCLIKHRLAIWLTASAGRVLISVPYRVLLRVAVVSKVGLVQCHGNQVIRSGSR